MYNWFSIYLSVSKHCGQVSCASILGEVNPQVSHGIFSQVDRLFCEILLSSFMTDLHCSMKHSLLSARP